MSANRPSAPCLPLALILLLAALPAAWAIDVAEPPDFPNPSGPATTLDPGNNIFSGTVSTPTDGQDRFMVTVPAGFRISQASKTASGGGFSGFVDVNGESINGTGAGTFTTGYPLGPGTYTGSAVANFSTGTNWTITFVVEAIPDYVITTGGGLLTITDVSGNGDVLTVSEPSAGTIQFAATGRVFKVDANPSTTGSSGSISLSGIDVVEIDTAAGDDRLDIGAFSNLDVDLTIDSGTGDDTVNLNGNLGFFPGSSLDIDLQDDDPNPGSDSINVAPGVQISIPAFSSIVFRCSRSVTVNSGALVRVQAGTLEIEANQQAAPTPGGFFGVHVAGGTVRNDDNDVVVRGTGGDDPGGFQLGVLVNGGGRIESLFGNVEVAGTGGASTNFVNRGVTVIDAGSVITADTGSVIVSGTAGPSGSSFGIGVALIAGGKISTTSPGGSVTVSGEGAGDAASGNNWGIEVGGAGAEIVTADGNIDINAIGGPNASPGLQVANSGAVTAGSALTVTVDRLNIDGTALVSGTTQTTLRHPVSSASIDLGGASGPAVLGLIDATLDRIATPDLRVDAADGDVVVSAPVSPDLVTNLTLESNSFIVPQGAGTDLAVPGTVTLAGPGGLSLNLDGLSPDTGYTRLAVAGGLDLNGIPLAPSVGYPGSVGETFTIVDNDGGDPVLGTFAGLPEGALLEWSASPALNAQISYTGGGGNDVVLTLVSALEVQNAAASGPGSLRDALGAASANPGPDTITFGPAVFDAPSPPIIQLDDTSGELLIDSALTIDASAIPGGVTIDGGSDGDLVLDSGETRCFLITDGDDDNDLPVTLRNLIIRNGVYGGGAAGANIHNRENLTLENCTIADGRAIGSNADGGGLYSSNGSLTLKACTISGNQASGSNADGGGIFSDTDLGGTTATITNSTIHGNTAEGRGGGYFNLDGLTRMVHCTVTGNTAAANAGGGIASYGDSFTRTELTATIVRDNNGGGVANDAQFVTDASNSFQSFGVNHVGTGNALGNFFLTTDETGEGDPILLAPLGDYGGPTETRPPLPGSPARERTTTPTTLTTDQRGVPRSLGARESGAVEVQPTIVLNANDSGPGSLRDTILFAAPTETITFDPGVFCVLPVPVIFLDSEILVDKALSIDASGIPDSVTIDGNSNGDSILDPGETRCFLITDGDPNNDLSVELRNLVIRNGAHEGTDAGANVHNREILTLEDCTITGGRGIGFGARGGGIFSVEGALSLINSTVSANQTTGALASGGGIYSDEGDLTLTACTVSQNQTLGGGSSGGGIYAIDGSLTITSSTISQNTALATDSDGGGIRSDTNLDGQIAIILNSTIHGNSAGDQGGGYYNHDGLVRFIHCTVTGNNAGPDKGGGIATYGDIFTRSELSATIVRDNPGSDVEFVNDTINSYLSLGGNLVGDGNGIPNFGAGGDQAGTTTPANLAPLGNYGGPTATRFPLAGSPAINGAASSSEASDQRGLARDGTPDIGAVEASQLVVTTADDENGALETGSGASLRECIAAAPAAGTITFDEDVFPSASGGTITLVVGPLAIDRNLTVDASAIPQGVTVSGDNTFRVLAVDSPAGANVTLRGLHLRDGFVNGTVFPNQTGGNLFIASGETVLMDRCTISDGFASFFGGGIGVSGVLQALSSTIARNSAGQQGGGIAGDGAIDILHATIMDNTAELDAGGVKVFATGFLALSNTIVADNRRDPFGVNEADDIDGAIQVSGTNIIEARSGTVSGTGTILADDPELAPFGRYGSGTPSAPPLPGSPAIEGGDPSVVVVLDQLGTMRPSGALPDIGAVEALPLGQLGLADTDLDGIPDILEGPGGPYPHLTVGTNDSAVDTDRDGHTDAEELGNMTDLYDINDRLKIISFVPNTAFHAITNPIFDITFTTFPGLTYTVESDQALTNFSAPAHYTFTATGFTTSQSLFFLPNFDFVRIRRED